MDSVVESMPSALVADQPERPSGVGGASVGGEKKRPKRLTKRCLNAALHRRPEALQVVVALRRLLEKKNILVAKLKARVKKLKKKASKQYHDSACQTDNVASSDNGRNPVHEKSPVAVEVSEEPSADNDVSEIGVEAVGWSLGNSNRADGRSQQKSLAEQVAEAAQNALAQTGMVYVESAGMYYDYKSGYYYNSESGLYYHSSTGCYYYYSEEKNEFTYHSHADTRAHATSHAATHAAQVAATPASLAPETQQLILKKEKLRKRNKKDNQEDEEKHGPTEAKRKKAKNKEKQKGTPGKETEMKAKKYICNDKNDDHVLINEEKELNTFISDNENVAKEKNSEEITPIKNNDDIFTDEAFIIGEGNKNSVNKATIDTEPVNLLITENEVALKEEDNDLKMLYEQKIDVTNEVEDGECSDTASEADKESHDSTSSDSTVTDIDECVAKHHPPCMRVVVRETSLPKLRVGTLFLVTKDGGTLGREGDDHAVLLRDVNISRIHLQFVYNDKKRCYEAIDLGSKNGTILNGTRMSESQQVSQPMEVVHGSTLQVGDSKLLCHIHAGADTCGHCEPGLLMSADDAEKRAAYTRTCTVKQQHALELARLKNRYAPEPLAIEAGTYNDRAKARRDAHGSTHHAEKTQQNDLDTSIATDNKGFQMLAKMGWKEGAGLGRDLQGEKEPVPLVSNAGTAGLGAGGTGAPGVVPAMRLAARPRRPLRPAASAFRDPLEEDD